MKYVAAIIITTIIGISPVSAKEPYFPQKPVHLIVAFPPGGDMDPIARKLAEKLHIRWGQPVIVENRPGANGIVGTNYVAKSAPDGYTLILCSVGALSVNPHVYSNLPYNVETEIEPVSLVAETPLVLVVNKSVPVNNVNEFVERAKENPGATSIASAGNGNITHLAAVYFGNRTNIDLLHVPYRGSGPAIMDLLGERVDAYFNPLPSALKYLGDNRRAKPLAVTSDVRSESLPDVPTMMELGYTGLNVKSWYGVCAPGGTPSEIINELNAGVVDAIENTDFSDFLKSAGTSPRATTSQEFGDLIREESLRWKKVAKDHNVRIN